MSNVVFFRCDNTINEIQHLYRECGVCVETFTDEEMLEIKEFWVITPDFFRYIQNNGGICNIVCGLYVWGKRENDDFLLDSFLGIVVR